MSEYSRRIIWEVKCFKGLTVLIWVFLDKLHVDADRWDETAESISWNEEPEKPPATL